MTNSQHWSEQIAFYTVRPDEAPASYADGTYRHVVGIDYLNRSLWLPNVSVSRVRPEAFSVPAGMGDRIATYFERYYLREPDMYRNCHIGAAAMTGIGDLVWVDALDHANGIMTRGAVIAGDKLPIGVQGVVGEMYEASEPLAYHSVVGIAPGVALQTDSENGHFSLVSHDDNLSHYQMTHATPHIQLYGRI